MAILATLGGVVNAPQAKAASVTWDGGSKVSSSWGTNSNWNPTGSPNGGDVLTFSGTTRQTNTNNLSIGVGGMTLETSGWNISGNALTTVTGSVSQSAPGVSTIALDMGLSGTVTSTEVGGASLNLSGVLSGTGALAKAGGGDLVLGGNNTYSGGTDLSGGFIRVAGDNALGTGAVTVSGNASIATNNPGAAQSLANAFAIGSGVTLNLEGNDFTLTLAGVIGGAGNIQSPSSGTVILSGVNTYTGATQINAGTLKAGATSGGQAFGNNSAVTLANVAGATLDLNNTNQTIGSLSGGGASGGNVTLGSGFLTTGGLNATGTYAGVISGTGGLTKNGTGALTLSGVDTYAGATNINGGTLKLDLSANSQVIKSGNAVNFNGGTLDFSASSANIQTLGATTVVSGANFITNSGGSGFAGTSVVDLGALSLTGGTLDIAGLRVGSKAVNNAAPLNNTWIKASGVGAGLNYINAGITTNNGRDLVATDAAKNLIIADTTDYERGATAYSNHASSIVRFIAPLIGQYGADNNGGPTITLDASTQVAPGTIEWGAILNAYASGTTTVDIGANILRLGVNGGITSAAGADTTLGAGANSGALSAGGAANTAGSITVAGANNTLINAKVRDNGSGKVSMVLSGPGKLTMAGDSDYTGSTTVNGGILLVNGTHNAGAGIYGVGAGGKLGGAGTIITTGAVVVDGQINGGDFGTVGTLSITGAGSRVLAGTYLFDVDYGTAASGDETGDLLEITGAASVAIAGGKFQLNAVGGATPAAGSHYAIRIFESDARVGGAPDGQSNYGGATVGLASYQSIVTWDGGKSYYLVPEPASFILLGLGSLLLLRRPGRRRGRKSK